MLAFFLLLCLSLSLILSLSLSLSAPHPHARTVLMLSKDVAVCSADDTRFLTFLISLSPNLSLPHAQTHTRTLSLDRRGKPHPLSRPHMHHPLSDPCTHPHPLSLSVARARACTLFFPHSLCYSRSLARALLDARTSTLSHSRFVCVASRMSTHVLSRHARD